MRHSLALALSGLVVLIVSGCANDSAGSLMTRVKYEGQMGEYEVTVDEAVSHGKTVARYVSMNRKDCHFTCRIAGNDGALAELPRVEMDGVWDMLTRCDLDKNKPCGVYEKGVFGDYLLVFDMGSIPAPDKGPLSTEDAIADVALLNKAVETIAKPEFEVKRDSLPYPE
jgi:hypothetical protein